MSGNSAITIGSMVRVSRLLVRGQGVLDAVGRREERHRGVDHLQKKGSVKVNVA